MSATELEIALRMFLNAQKQKSNQFAKGKQTLKEFIGQNVGVTNIEVNEGNIKAFERVARKYGIDFALKKDKSFDAFEVSKYNNEQECIGYCFL